MDEPGVSHGRRSLSTGLSRPVSRSSTPLFDIRTEIGYHPSVSAATAEKRLGWVRRALFCYLTGLRMCTQSDWTPIEVETTPTNIANGPITFTDGSFFLSLNLDQDAYQILSEHRSKRREQGQHKQAEQKVGGLSNRTFSFSTKRNGAFLYLSTLERPDRRQIRFRLYRRATLPNSKQISREYNWPAEGFTLEQDAQDGVARH